MPRPTLQAVARAAGLSRSGAAYALKGDPSIPPATVQRVRAAAAAVGYRPDSRISTLMARIRRGRSAGRRETIGFVWISTPGKGGEWPTHPRYYASAVLAGAQRRAEEFGCGLTAFRLDESGMTPQRLSQILRSRGIAGVIFSPSALDLVVRLDWNWDLFACAVIGNTEWVPPLHRAGHNHYRSMWVALQRLVAEGFRRPAALINRNAHERTHGMQLAAFLVNHPVPERAGHWARFGQPGFPSAPEPWTRRNGPDALIVGWQVQSADLPHLRRLAPGARGLVTLDWRPESAVPGMDACHEVIAASAVDLVLAQLHRNERGIPAHPSTLLIEGVWRASAPALAAAKLAR